MDEPTIDQFDVTVRDTGDGETHVEIVVEITNSGPRAYRSIEAAFNLRDGKGKLVSRAEAMSGGPLLPDDRETISTSTWIKSGTPKITAVECHLKLTSIDTLRAKAKPSHL